MSDPVIPAAAFMKYLSDPIARRIYRPRAYYLAVGVVCLLFFSSMGVASTYTAYWNIDGSFRHPKPAALFFGSFWSVWVLLSLWTIAGYFRERLVVDKRTITQRGILFTRVLQSSEIVAVRWRQRPIGGKVIVCSSSGRSLGIYLSNFAAVERDELIGLLHQAAPLERQEGWHEFMKPRPPVGLPQRCTALAAVCAFLFFLFGSLFIANWWLGVGMQHLVVGMANLLAGMWYVWRAAAESSKSLSELRATSDIVQWTAQEVCAEGGSRVRCCIDDSNGDLARSEVGDRRLGERLGRVAENENNDHQRFSI